MGAHTRPIPAAGTLPSRLGQDNPFRRRLNSPRPRRLRQALLVHTRGPRGCQEPAPFRGVGALPKRTEGALVIAAAVAQTESILTDKGKLTERNRNVEKDLVQLRKEMDTLRQVRLGTISPAFHASLSYGRAHSPRPPRPQEIVDLDKDVTYAAAPAPRAESSLKKQAKAPEPAASKAAAAPVRGPAGFDYLEGSSPQKVGGRPYEVRSDFTLQLGR